MIESGLHGRQRQAIAKGDALQGEVLTRFEEQGVTLHTYDDDMLKAFYAATQTVMERKSAEDEQFAKVYASMMEFQRELSPWSENGYIPRDWLREHVYDKTSRRGTAGRAGPARSGRVGVRCESCGGRDGAMSDYQVDPRCGRRGGGARPCALFPGNASRMWIDGSSSAQRRCSTGSGCC